MHFSVKNTTLHFPTNGHIRDAPVCELHWNLKLEAIAITIANFVEIKEKHQKISCSKDIQH